MKRIITLSLLLATAAAHAQFDAIRTLRPYQGQEVKRPVEAKVFNSTAEELPALEKELLGIFKDSGTTLEGKQYTCRMLRFCASEACIPVLAPELTNPELSSFVRLVFQGLETEGVMSIQPRVHLPANISLELQSLTPYICQEKQAIKAYS